MPKLLEKLALKGLAHVITPYVGSWHIFGDQNAFGNLVREKEIAYVKGACPSAGTKFSIGLKEDSTFVVLEEDI